MGPLRRALPNTSLICRYLDCAEGRNFVREITAIILGFSCTWGTVPLDYLVGKALLVYWPPQFWKMLDTATPALAAPGKEPAIR
jgi:hypothetical protein